ncbi:MAG: hypothetical protein ACPHRO_14730, partial [Nannocystaceae bacterium]
MLPSVFLFAAAMVSAPADPTEPAIQRPSSSTTPTSTPTPAPAPAPAPALPAPTSPLDATPPPQVSPADNGNPPASDQWPRDPARGAEDAAPVDGTADATAGTEPEAEGKKRSERFGGRKFFRFAISPRFGWTNGVSQKNGLFDLQSTINSSIQNMEGTITGAGDLGREGFGGWAYGFDIDLEILFINIWADFDKFINPGGMWTLRVGYDHDFRPHERININLGLGPGFMRIFLGDALEQLDFDPDDPTKTDIARAGFVTRLNLNFDIWLAGPLYTGPQFMVGYHYLFSADDESVIAEKGMH